MNDYETQLGTAINSMLQNDSMGSVIGVKILPVSPKAESIDPSDFDFFGEHDFDIFIFDGGNAHGDSWKNIFLPKTKQFSFFSEVAQESPGEAADTSRFASRLKD